MAPVEDYSYTSRRMMGANGETLVMLRAAVLIFLPLLRVHNNNITFKILANFATELAVLIVFMWKHLHIP